MVGLEIVIIDTHMSNPPPKIFNPMDPNDELEPVALQLVADVEAGVIDDDTFSESYWKLCGFTRSEGQQINVLSIYLDVPAPILIQHFQSVKFENGESILLVSAKERIDEAADDAAREAARRTYQAFLDAYLQ